MAGLDDRQRIRRAADALGWRIATPVLLSDRKTRVWQTWLHPTSTRPLGERAVVRIAPVNHDNIPASTEHLLTRTLRQRGVSVVAALHEEPVEVDECTVGFWERAERCTQFPDLSAWGSVLRDVHSKGSGFSLRPFNPLDRYQRRIQQAFLLADDKDHPLFGQRALIARVTDQLSAAAADMPQPSTEAVVVHGDNQPANLLVRNGQLALNDWERAGTGAAAVDFGYFLLGQWHFGWAPSLLETVRQAYGPEAPTIEEITPFARVREVSSTLVAMIDAAKGPEANREMHVRLATLGVREAGPQWTWLGEPASMRPDSRQIASRPGPTLE